MGLSRSAALLLRTVLRGLWLAGPRLLLRLGGGAPSQNLPGLPQTLGGGLARPSNFPASPAPALPQPYPMFIYAQLSLGFFVFVFVLHTN